MHKITLHSWKHDSCFQLNIPIGAAIFSNLSGPFPLWDSKEVFPPRKKPGKPRAGNHAAAAWNRYGPADLWPLLPRTKVLSPEASTQVWFSVDLRSSIYNVRKEYLLIMRFVGFNHWFCTQVMIAQMLTCYYSSAWTITSESVSLHGLIDGGGGCVGVGWSQLLWQVRMSSLPNLT